MGSELSVLPDQVEIAVAVVSSRKRETGPLHVGAPANPHHGERRVEGLVAAGRGHARA